MGKSILSNSISKIGQQVNEPNNERRKTAIRDIAACLERCYREFFKYYAMKNSHDKSNADLAFKNSEKMVNLINELKGEINGELLRISCFSPITQKGELNAAIETDLNEIINSFSNGEDRSSKDLAKVNVINDFEEMKKTMALRKLDHISRYPIGTEEKKNDGKVIPLIKKCEYLAPWQIKVMNGEDDGFFREATMDAKRDSSSRSILDLDKYREHRNDDGR